MTIDRIIERVFRGHARAPVRSRFRNGLLNRRILCPAPHRPSPPPPSPEPCRRRIVLYIIYNVRDVCVRTGERLLIYSRVRVSVRFYCAHKGLRRFTVLSYKYETNTHKKKKRKKINKPVVRRRTGKGTREQIIK